MRQCDNPSHEPSYEYHDHIFKKIWKKGMGGENNREMGED